MQTYYKNEPSNRLRNLQVFPVECSSFQRKLVVTDQSSTFEHSTITYKRPISKWKAYNMFQAHSNERLLHLHRPHRRLSPHSHQQTFTQIPAFSLGWIDLSVQKGFLRPIGSPMAIHQANKTDTSLGGAPWVSGFQRT